MATTDLGGRFNRIQDRIDVERMQRSRVVIVGQGAVGSHVAEDLTRSAVGTLVLIDGERLDPENLVRHVLGEMDVGESKAEAMSRHLSSRLESIRVEYSPHHITNRFSNETLDRTLLGAQLIIAATDSRRAQRRINRRSLDLDIPALFPGVDATSQRGEVLVSLGRGRTPCFECWDRFRDETQELREVSALKTDITPTVDLTVRLALAVLDPSSDYAAIFARPHETRERVGGRPPTLFFAAAPGVHAGGMFDDGRLLRSVFPAWRDQCPACGGDPNGRHVAAPALARRTAANRTAQTRFETTAERPRVLPRAPAQRLSGTAIFWTIVILGGLAGCNALSDWADRQQAEQQSVASSPSPPPATVPQPETLPPRSAVPSYASDPLAGDWTGRGTDLSTGNAIFIATNPMRFRLDVSISAAGGSPGEEIGTYSYRYESGQVSAPSEPCTGSLTLVSRSDSAYVLRQRETPGNTECLPYGRETVHIRDGTLRWRETIRREDGVTQIVSARLSRSAGTGSPSGDAIPSEDAAVRQTVLAWGRSASPEEGCPLLTDAYQRRRYGARGSACWGVSGWQSMEYELSRVTVNGEVATATLGDGSTFALIRTSDEIWRIDGCGGSAC